LLALPFRVCFGNKIQIIFIKNLFLLTLGTAPLLLLAPFALV